MRDRRNPDIFEALRVNPGLGVDPAALEVAIPDLRRWTRRYLKPTAKLISLVVVTMIVICKRLLPFQFRAHRLIDVLCIWFMRRFVSPEAVTSLIRHFVIETNLLNFVAKNCGAPDVEEVTLKPIALKQMGNHAVIQHDINIYNLILDLGYSPTANVKHSRPLTQLDYSMLTVPPIDTEPERHRWLQLDIETALYLMNIPFCLFTTEDEYERAVNSFQLDESLLGFLADLTGDPVFRTWTPLRFPAWLNIARDVPRDLYWHAIVNELAHGRLCAMRAALEAGESWPLTTETSPHA
ncbi:MAG: DUF6999 family protein [Myxococcota bacterium]